MDLGLRGKVTLVTAASKGMGKACAMAFGAEGARVAMCARTEADLKAAADEVRAATKAEVLAVTADVTKKDNVQALVERVTSQFGGVDVLVANAGGPARGFFEELSDEQWQQAFELSLLSVVRLIRAVLPGMQARKWGRVLTIQSVSVKQPLPDLLLSNAVRPGTAGLMKTLAGRFGKDGITFNTVCPGRIMTDRFMSGLKTSGLSREEYLARGSAEIPLGRVGTPEEFANVIAFLASERASYVTGVAVQVDGGLVRGLL
ncbi:MAG TPA: SDR family oxidoreductase [Methylomirabilota bacterium]|jgi:3-oxoacyl-[acyl-carrier protein] reductase|nr:SDR family oxidoreductase [Methylomirabilota bacterium]